MRELLKKIYCFYRHDCCWPYAVSFPLVLLIYGLERQTVVGGFPWASIGAYAILFAYWGYNVYLYNTTRFAAKDGPFFIRWLSLKIAVWLAVLIFFAF